MYKAQLMRLAYINAQSETLSNLCMKLYHREVFKKEGKRSVIYQKVASSTVLAYAPPPISRPIPAAVNNLPCSSNSHWEFEANREVQLKHTKKSCPK